MSERRKLILLIAAFLGAYLLPLGDERVRGALLEAFWMLRDYAREHVLFCLVPAFFIAGAIGVFVSQAAVMRYFGAQANRVLAYSVAAVSGGILAVCSCTVLPLFAGIHRRGAGIGPAAAFLYAGPAVNVLAIVLTARVLGWKLGLARALFAVGFSIVIGLVMALIFRREEQERAASGMFASTAEQPRPLWRTGLYFLSMVLILVFAAWAKPKTDGGLWHAIYAIKWPVVGVLLLGLGLMLRSWFNRDELRDWVDSTWDLTKQIAPLLLAGVLVAGFLLGRPGMDAGIIPGRYVASLVGGNSLSANLFASVAGALMYFATLTEVPILEGLIGAGMGQGPALTLLLAGPALSLPNMIVIYGVLGPRKSSVYFALVIVMSAAAGTLYGALVQ
ncbi:MAG: permease [Candidatus Alcyoniella australis]|nr:permease [Candidatus Alcyoniella australis]